MCGIIGYVGDRPALPLVAAGLRNLEYRGYDSAGVALNGTSLDVYKRTGTVDDLDLPDDSHATCGVGHTRWSTHGEPTDANAHPHTDEAGSVAVVHNGIVENFDDLRTELEARGHAFESETDTEVIPHLIEEEWDGGDLTPAVKRAMSRLRGSYAIAVVAEGFDGIVAARKGSPLVVGHGDGGYFVASDVPAFVEHTRDVSYLEDGDVVRVTADETTVFDDGREVDRPVETVDWEPEAAAKGGYEHYMLKEIHEQPNALQQTLSGRIDVVEGTVDLDVSVPPAYVNSLEEIQLVAAGTSYHAGRYAKALLEQFADVRVTVEVASEYEFTGGRDPWRTLVVAVTQSGETADTLEAMRRAGRAGARTLAVTNTVGSTAAREADDALYTRVGPEISVAATKTFLGQVSTLAMLAVSLGRVRNVLSASRASDRLADLRDLPGAVQQALDRETAVRDCARRFLDSRSYFFVGRRLGHAVSLEGALKLKEISYVHAEGFPAGELKHGTLALVTEDTPVLAVLTEGTDPTATLNNVKEVEARGAPVVGVASDGVSDRYLDVKFPVPDCGPFEPLVANVYLQLFAYHTAREKGLPIDKPRNLAKSVTVE